jgi:hypothetical protein
MATSLERRIQEFSLRMGQQTDSFSQEIQVKDKQKQKTDRFDTNQRADRLI